MHYPVVNAYRHALGQAPAVTPAPPAAPAAIVPGPTPTAGPRWINESQGLTTTLVATGVVGALAIAALTLFK